METQFRYGATWQYRCRLGEALAWGKNDVGEENRDAAVLGVVDGPCPKCGCDDDWELVVIVRSNRLAEVVPLQGQYDFGGDAEAFVYLSYLS